MVRPSGLEPPTPTMSRWCSNQLSYGRTTGTNISGREGKWQEAIATFLSDFTRLRKQCANCRESSRREAAERGSACGARQNDCRRLALEEAHPQHH